MKKYIAFFALSLISMAAFAQEQINVHYISQTTFEIDENEKRDEFTEALEEAMKEIHEFNLTIDGAQSTFKSVEKIKNDQKKEGVSISFGIPNSNLFKDVEKKFYIKKTHHEGYLEKDSLTNFDWQLTREKDKVLNYEVRKAIIKDSTQTIEAWYAPKLTFKTGPKEYWGLPGLILKLEIYNQGEGNEKTYYLANAIEILEDAKPLDIPNDGKEVSAEKIKELNEEQMQFYKDMQEQGVDTSD